MPVNLRAVLPRPSASARHRLRQYLPAFSGVGPTSSARDNPDKYSGLVHTALAAAAASTHTRSAAGTKQASTRSRPLIPLAAATAITASTMGVTSADEQDLRSAKVVVMSIPACPYCKRAKEALSGTGIPYVDVNVAASDDLRTKVKEITGRRTVPQIFVNGASIGGSDDLAKMLENGSFQSLLDNNPGPALTEEVVKLVEQAKEQVAAQEASAAEQAAAASNNKHMQDLVKEMQADGAQLPRGAVKVGNTTYTAFLGEQLISWLQGHSAVAQSPRWALRSRSEAVKQAQELLEARLIAPVATTPPPASAVDFHGSNDSMHLYQIVAEAPPPAPGDALNTHYWWYGQARPATQVANDLRHLILDLYDKYLSKDGRSVNYKKIATDPLFREYVDATAELQKVDISQLNREELIAFAINLYNALIIHALVVYGTHMDWKQRATFFSKAAKYNIGGFNYTADDLENGILRGNRPPASSLLSLIGLPQFAQPQFKSGDPRAAKIVRPIDHRLHFALVCGAKSCPPIKLYTPENLEEGLAAAAEAFCQSEVSVDASKREVQLSKIFKWYGIDFGKDDREKLTSVLQYLQGTAKDDLQRLLNDGHSVRVLYKEYDWTVNASDEV